MVICIGRCRLVSEDGGAVEGSDVDVDKKDLIYVRKT
jgi:hypothetical protein